MYILGKVLFLVLALCGIVAIFYVSWFWRGLIGVMVAILLVDVISGFFKKKSS